MAPVRLFLSPPALVSSPDQTAQSLMSDEVTCTDLVLDDDDVLMGEMVIADSTFPAAPLVRPPVRPPVMIPPVLAIEQTAETLITAASPSDIVRMSPTVATCTSLVTSSHQAR